MGYEEAHFTKNEVESILRVVHYIYINPKTRLNHDIVIVNSSFGRIFLLDLNKVVKNIVNQENQNNNNSINYPEF